MSTINNIIVLMEMKKVTAAELCRETGISQGNFSDWKANRASPKLPAIFKIANYLNTSIDYLTRISDENEQQESPVYDDEAWDYMQELYKQKILFKTGKKVTKQDIEEAIRFLEFRTSQNNDE